MSDSGLQTASIIGCFAKFLIWYPGIQFIVHLNGKSNRNGHDIPASLHWIDTHSRLFQPAQLASWLC